MFRIGAVLAVPVLSGFISYIVASGQNTISRAEHTDLKDRTLVNEHGIEGMRNTFGTKDGFNHLLDEQDKLNLARVNGLATRIDADEKSLSRLDAVVINLTSVSATLRDLAARVEGLNSRADEINRRLAVAEAILSKSAREPIEASTARAVSDALAKQIDLLQQEITDINRQIAAVLLAIEGNTVRRPVAPP